jgi:hypothetical protein
MNPKNIFPVAICIVISAGILLVGLWPFNFHPENKVSWLQDRDGVRFYGRGIIYSEKEVPILPSIHPSNTPTKSFTIEIWLQPKMEPNSYLPRLFSFCDTQKNENFFTGQWKSELILRRRDLSSKKPETYKEIGVQDALPTGQVRFVTITSGIKGTSIYIDGRQQFFPHYILISENDRISDYLILGNSPTGESYWTGNLFGLAIYDQELNAEKVFQHFQRWIDRKAFIHSSEESLLALYLFNERSGEHIHDTVNRHHLLMPPRFQALQKRVLVLPWTDFQFNRSYLIDILTNILGFIPFGFFFAAYFCTKKRTTIYRLLLISTLLGGCISLAIELIQVYLPARSSQLMDVTTNIIGTAIGVALFFKTRKSEGACLPVGRVGRKVVRRCL